MANKDELKRRLKGFIGVVAVTPIAGVAVKQIADTPQFPKGISEATQVTTGTGLLVGAGNMLLNGKKKKGIL